MNACDRIVVNARWSEATAAQKLAEAIRGKARIAFSRMPVEDTLDYEAIKKAILKCFDLTPDALRRKFRSSIRQPDESHREWSIRLESLMDNWIDSEGVRILSEDAKKLREVFIKEHFVNKVSQELQRRIKEQSFDTLKDLANLQ